MEYFKKHITEVLDVLKSSTKGLGEEEAKLLLSKHGPNELKKKKKVSPVMIFLSQFNSFIIYILLVAVVVSVVLHEYIDSVVIAIIIIMNGVLGFIQEFRAEKAIDSLKKLSSLKSTVIRGGKKQRVDSSDLVPGDILTFEAGDKISADARIIECARLELTEAMLTGESLPVKKKADALQSAGSLGDMKNMVFSGTSVLSGSGLAVITATGMETEIGKIAKSIESVEDDETPLQKNLDSFGKKLGILTLIICAVVVALGVFQGGELLEMVMVGISLAVAAVPEGLPIVVTIALAIGTQKMASQNALMKRLHAVETLGCTTVICTDKTGTLTKNEMTVVKCFVNGEVVEVSGSGYLTEGTFSINGNHTSSAELKKLLEIGLLNNDAALTKDGAIIGDPTEGSLIVSAAKAGLIQKNMNNEFPRINEIPFDSERKRKTTVHKTGDSISMYVKGAPDGMIAICDRILTRGEVKPLDDTTRESILKVNSDFAGNAIRVLAFACKELTDYSDDVEPKEEGLIFVGLQGMIDPPRTEVKEAIATCKSAGIRSVMITGDYSKTAKAIAESLGIEGDVLSGSELDGMDEETLSHNVKNISIFARVNPEHKIRIVRSLRESGEVVAMSGDGVNDAPAIKEADIGVAMGITGTDVSKDTADMILTDDRYTSIVHAVEQGRGIYENIQKFINYLLSSNLGEVLILFGAMVLGFTDPATGSIAMPLIATQILWLNLVTDGLPAVAMGVDPIRPTVMDAKPRDPKEKIITKKIAANIVLISTLMAVAVLILFWRFLPEGAEVARTIAFTSIVLLEMVRIVMIRSQYGLSFFSNMYLIWAVAVSLILQVGVVYIPFLNTVFKTAPLNLTHWAYMGVMVVILFVVGNLAVKFINRGRA
jgi:Ca2+-transporting ATPase